MCLCGSFAKNLFLNFRLPVCVRDRVCVHMFVCLQTSTASHSGAETTAPSSAQKHSASYQTPYHPM